MAESSIMPLSLSNRMRRFINSCAFFVHDCGLCGQPADRPVCAACLAALPQLAGSACPRCGVRHPAGGVCHRCRLRPPAFDALHAGQAYQWPLSAVLHRCKYGGDLQQAGLMAYLMLVAAPVLPVGAVLVPVPLSRRAHPGRDFNHSAELAGLLAQATGLPVCDVLSRVRDTPPQAGLGRRQRLRNMAGAFASAALPAGQSCVLVDDVLTTGATLSAAARALKRAGAGRVEGWVWLRAQPG